MLRNKKGPSDAGLGTYSPGPDEPVEIHPRYSHTRLDMSMGFAMVSK